MESAGYVFQSRKSRALLPTIFPCVGPVHSLNVLAGGTRRSPFSSATRYHRGPPIVYTDLPRQVAEELARAHPRSPRPELVIVGTASDALGETPLVRELLAQALEHLFAHGVSVAIRTRGPIGEPFLGLFRRHAPLARVQVVLSPLREGLRAAFEPDDPLLEARLADLDALRRDGTPFDVLVKPLIPFLSDDEPTLDTLFGHLFRLGVRRAAGVVPPLHATTMAGLPADLDPVPRGLLLGAYGLRHLRDAPRAGHDAGLPLPARARQVMLDTVVRQAKRHRVRFAPCRCSGHDLGVTSCLPGLAELIGHAAPAQVELL